MPSKKSALAGLLEDPPFDPEGKGYDSKTAAELNRLYPLTMPKPKPPADRSKQVTRANPGAFSAWVWYPSRNDWFVHGSSRDPRTGQILKGRKHTSYKDTELGEKKEGNLIYKDPVTKKYYSFPKAAVMAKASPSRAAIIEGAKTKPRN